MAKPIGVWRRDDSSSYYFYRRFPTELVEAAGRRFYKKSLRTSDLAEAKRRCHVAAVEFDQLCDSLRAQLTRQPYRAPLWTMDQVRQRIRAYVEERDTRTKAAFSDDPEPADPTWREERLQESQALISLYTDATSEDTQLGVAVAARTIFGVAPGGGFEFLGDLPYDARQDVFGEDGPLAHFSPAQQSEVWELIRRALLELERRAVATLRSDFRRPSFDHEFSPALATPVPVSRIQPAISISDLSRGYLAEYPNRRSVKAKRHEKIESTILLMVEFFGPDTPVHSIDRRRCREFRDFLNVLPVHRSKHFPHRTITLQQVVEQTKRRGLPTLSRNSQEGCLATLKDLVRWARLENVGWEVDLTELAPLGQKQDADDAREPFTTEQLNRIFNAPLYRGGPEARTSAGRVSGETRYWTPLIALFTGMRLNEICQLHVADVQHDDHGLAFISVNAEAPDKSVKTRHGERRIPVHPDLVALGFLRLVEERRREASARLFPELARSERGYYSEDVSKWFGRTFLPSAGAKGPKTVFHSFRHSFRDALRRAEAPKEVVWALGGWASGEGVSGAYGSGNLGYTVEQLHRWISRVSYPGLDLSHLRRG